MVLGQVLKSDVEAALQVLNFAIYHQELTEMEEREQEREVERKQRAERDSGNNDRTHHEGSGKNRTGVDNSADKGG